ncbi:MULTISPECIES: HAD-IC family P-type ATPase [Corynebacterium]|uniref:HAD-IC family P-type ATPase n=1 Tax=Corynebacterium TaxID=1716 RepID=UPI0008A965C5|nr:MULTISPECIES: HAD-IC family P-type ATPase [Corynebacterium]MBC6763021.1 magnesium-transporting ATPase [Corynebacterium sp. LK27]MDK7111013.1 HAD-IC family P-type ATPase [Corynebacterium amycolatum]MDK7146177.1 HAD-IC family P-type ATPase [Corynebacterium amycolatum]OHR35265.1 magnesium-transporting ATPase [Corynebacterium sp. HMSC074C03]
MGSWETPDSGLTQQQVQQRIKSGQVNELPPTSGRSVRDIIRANVFTRINGILAVLFAVVLYTGSIVNGAFGLLIIANSIVGIVQELRAKYTLDKLSIVGRAKPMVIRDGEPAREIDRESVVLDDLIEVGPGDQIVVDGILRYASDVAVDESSLTGESDAVDKSVGDMVYSGSSIVVGSARYQATKVGKEAYAAKLAAEANKFTLTDSQLFRGINKILTYISWILIPVGALAIYTQLFVAGDDLNDALLGMVATLVPMVPEGLVLMTTIAFALGVVRLGRHRVLVNELPAIEGLARVDTVCVDKTGTLTENAMQLVEVDIVSGDGTSRDELDSVLINLCKLDDRPNATARALLDGLADAGDVVKHEQTETRPFTSANKWSALTYHGGATWVFGAPDVLVDDSVVGMQKARQLMEEGLRVLLLARTTVGANDLPGGALRKSEAVELEPVALVVLGQKVRSDAAETVAYFYEEGVEVKVISGDNDRSVGAVARELKMEGADNPVDASELPASRDENSEAKPTEIRNEFADIVESRQIFGRVTAENKRDMVHALQSRGHHVAMTGDGVNDVLALKAANLGVAMGDGAPATRSVAQLVLLDNRFAVMPMIVAEGRRVIGNIERVANLFLTKTIYSVVLALAVGLWGMDYPFEPIHVTITGWFTIGIPAFVLSLAPNWERARDGFVRRVLRLAIPAGITVGLLTFMFWLWANPGVDASDVARGEASTATLIVLIVSAFWVLVVVARPYTWWKVLLLAVSAGAYLFIFSVRSVASVLNLYWVGQELLIPALIVGAIGAAIIEALWWWRQSRPLPEEVENTSTTA